MKQRGFTLLELVIALSILVVLMLFSNLSIQNGLRAKTKIQEQVETMSAVRDALRIMEKDVNLGYHYRDIEADFKKAVQQSVQTQQGAAAGANPQGGAGQSTTATAQQIAAQQTQAVLQQWIKPDPQRQDPTTNFSGSDSDFHFITMNTGRLLEDQAQADFVKVGYYIVSCHPPGSDNLSTKCLARSEDLLVEGEVTKNGPQTILLADVTEFKLRYIGAGKTDWVSNWDSKVGDSDTKGNYPDAVEISLSTAKGEGNKKRKVSMQIVASVHFTNNLPPGAAAQANLPPGQPNSALGAAPPGPIP